MGHGISDFILGPVACFVQKSPPGPTHVLCPSWHPSTLPPDPWWSRCNDNLVTPRPVESSVGAGRLPLSSVQLSGSSHAPLRPRGPPEASGARPPRDPGQFPQAPARCGVWGGSARRASSSDSAQHIPQHLDS